VHSRLSPEGGDAVFPKGSAMGMCNKKILIHPWVKFVVRIPILKAKRKYLNAVPTEALGEGGPRCGLGKSRES